MAKANVFDDAALLTVLGQAREGYQAGAQWSEHHSLQRKEGDRWLEVGRFPSKDVAKLARDALVAHGHGATREFRIKKVTIPPRA